MNLITLSFINASRANDLWFTIRYLIVATLFIYFLWLFSKFLTKKSGISLKDRRIKLHERLPLSNDKYLILIELENIFYLVACDKNGYTVIDKRDNLDFSRFDIPQESHQDFLQVMKRVIKKEENKSKE